MPRPSSRPRRPVKPSRAASSPKLAVLGGLLTVAVLSGLLYQLYRATSGATKEDLPEVTFTGALDAIDAGKVANLHLNDGSRRATLILKNGVQASTVYPDGSGPALAERAGAARVKVTAAPNGKASMWPMLLLNLLPVALLIGFLFFFMAPRGRMNPVSRMRSNPADVPSTRFSDVAGAAEAVAELSEVVEFLHDPDRFRSAGARLPRGCLLVGPPGTGKTLLARAVAGEAGVPFFSLAGSDFVETFVGVGAARVRQVFAAARKRGRAIVFIDEIDAVGKVRAVAPPGSGSEERDHTLNQLLVEMDGFTQSGVIVLAATNRADVLDPALTRPGRFDRRIAVPAPDRLGRTRILELYARDRRMAPDVDLVALGRRTPGLTGADLASLVNEAALEAARTGSAAITSAHLDAALATSVMGRERRSTAVTERDRRITAWHEAGHAVAALLLPHAEDPVSVTIVPRGESGGATWTGGNDHTFLTRSEAEARLVVAMAGRAAEEVHLDGDYTQGATGDFVGATNLARAMVTEYGMSDLGVTWRGSTVYGTDPQSEQVGTALDALLARALGQARELIRAHVGLVETVASELLAEETLSWRALADLAHDYDVSRDATAVQDQLAAIQADSAGTLR